MEKINPRKILLIIPTYNEADNIIATTKAIRKVVPELDILIVDDNSPDGTGAIADDLASKDGQINVLHRTDKTGLGAAYLAGFNWGMARDYQAFIEFDADGSHQPKELPKLIAALADADMVKGSRWVKGGSVVNWPKSREFLSRGGSIYTRLMLGLPVKDITGGLNLIRREALAEIIKHPIDTTGYGIQRDLTWNAHRLGYRVVEVPIEFKDREFGQSKMSKQVLAEALKRTTQLGAAHRFGQLKKVGQQGGQKLARGLHSGWNATSKILGKLRKTEAEESYFDSEIRVSQVPDKVDLESGSKAAS